ncbi:MAG: TolC family protein [Candidatus Ratteibacteria bacterium]|nr:TolC family protein [Candidatus Ratteibacteria bacterium]
MRKFVFLLILSLPFFVFAQGNALNLDQSISIALENNASIKLASEKIKEANAAENQALSYFFPKIYSSSSYTRLDEESTMDMGGASMVLSDDEIYDYNLNLVQPIFHGGLIPAYKLQRENLKASQFSFEAVQNDLIMEVKKAYFAVLETEKIKEAAEESVEQVKAHLEIIEAYYGEGMASEVEVLRVKVALANAKHNLINADSALELAKSLFNSLLNRNLAEEVILEDTLCYKDYGVELASAVSAAINSRPEVKEMESKIKVSQSGASIARSSFFPQVSLIGNWDRVKGAELPIDEWKESWSAIVSVEMDIWDWGENFNEVRKANAQLEQAKSGFALLKNGVELEVRQSYFNLLSAKEKIKVRDEAAREADKNFKNTSLQFKEGLSTNADVLDAQVLLSQAKANYYQSLYEYNVAVAGIERAMGLKTIQNPAPEQSSVLD